MHTIAVRDRVDVSSLSDEVRVPDLESIQLDNLLPSSEDERSVLSHFAVLIARTLVKYMPFFAKFGKEFEKHILHEYTEEMTRKSEVVNI